MAAITRLKVAYYDVTCPGGQSVPFESLTLERRKRVHAKAFSSSLNATCTLSTAALVAT